MRVPGDDLGGTINAYLAMQAALAAVLDHNRDGAGRIGDVAVPGLGTGVGGMAPVESALQMRAAFDERYGTMRIGILADIHEDLGHLRWAINVLGEQGAECLVLLGDVFELGHRLDETVTLLDEAGAVGVWGNHDFGLCRDNPRPEDRRRYGERVLDFMSRLRPRLEVEGCLFTHIEPWLDPEKIEDLWYFDGPPEMPERVARIFAAAPNRVTFMGHYHGWLLVTPEGLQPWSGDEPTVLEVGTRYLVAVHAVCAGRCALFDTETHELIPFAAGAEGRDGLQ